MIWDKWLMQLVARKQMLTWKYLIQTMKDCYVAILSQNKGGVVEISDVTLKKK